MARLKPNRAYRTLAGQNFSRPDYVRSIPALKIIQFEMGGLPKDQQIMPIMIYRTSIGQLRQNSIESARLSIIKKLNKKIGLKNYRYVLNVYPHQFLRENKFATGAGADRTSQGMRLAFGKAIDRAVRINHANQKLLTIFVATSENKKIVKDVLHQVTPKIGISTAILSP
jgi:large subunit ribosomal protein L10e